MSALLRLFERPLLAEPGAVATVLGVLADKLDIGRIALGPELLTPAETRGRGAEVARPSRGYAVEGGVATIPVIGNLVSRALALAPQSGLTGYNALHHALDEAVADPEVLGILLEVDSPGGEAAGCFDLARRVRAAAAAKPLWAVLDEQAFSAGYAIASGASRVLVPRSGGAGSIGAVAVHIDRSGELAAAGRRVTVIRAGDRKADGNPFEPLPKDVAARWAAELDDLRAQFAALVAEHRGIPEAAVLATEGDTYLAPAALELGLVDDIMPAREAARAFREHLAAAPVPRSLPPPPSEEMMTTLTTTTTQQPRPAAAAYAHAGGGAHVEAIRHEVRARFAGILGLPDAQGDLAPLASHLAAETDLGVDQAAAVLAVAKGLRLSTSGHTDFASAMAQVRNPRVGADSGEDEQEVEAVLRRARAREGRA